jgi:GT2 family glycosyltransferase
MGSSAVTGISVIIPNFNGRNLLAEILPSLVDALQDTKLPFEIIVSDDCSTDESVSYLQVNYPQVKILISEKNRGFAITINRGVFAAKYSHLLLLNSDVKLNPGYFQGLLRYFNREDTFGVMSRIIGWDDDIIQDGGKYPYFHGVKIKTSGNYVPIKDEPEPWLYTMYLSGANAFVSREKILELQGFDELFVPFYVEDYELSLRAWRMGWKCYYDHAAVCRHKVSVSIRSTNKRREIAIVYNRNKMYLHAIHLSQGKRFLWFLQLIPESLMRLLTLQMTWFGSLYRFLKNYGNVIRSRERFRQVAIGRKQLTVDEVIKQVDTSLKQKGIRLI